ncbi:hypothetical protein TPA4_6 [Tsukamurella phage TPA4]|uniref:head scaffolding protein n=1 Tax=Tsukamurella phage TPA4 TaxID=1647476 RepID=UPI0007B62041|nr:head scaffolding protein [Tsukamurella phage TPA4]AKJ72171.1 hypothetical protein TPA4_6 [Tsukamurella phage TPA4]
MSDLPIHPITGLQALGVTRRGPIWPALGASQDDPSNGGAQQSATGEQGKPTGGDEPLGEGGKKALESERAARKAADVKAAELQKQVDALTKAAEDAAKANDDRPELEKRLEAMQKQLDDAVAAQKKSDEAAATATLAQLRIDRGAAKGLPPALAKLLTATTAEELDAEIDALLPHVKIGPLPNPQQGNPSQGKGGSIATGRDRYAAANKK